MENHEDRLEIHATVNDPESLVPTRQQSRAARVVAANHKWPSENKAWVRSRNSVDGSRTGPTSLLGLPVASRGLRRDARYRKLQTRIYNFLERPRGVRAIGYHVVVFFMVFMCLALSVFSTIKGYEELAGTVLFYMETVVVVWFTVEFVFRLWSSGCRSRYQGFLGRIKFLRRPFCIIDVITIAASFVVLSLGTSGQVFATSALRGLRFFQILRMVRMDRRGGTWKLLGSVVYAHRQELFTTLYIGFLGLIFSSFLVYLAEKDANPDVFSNFADALWWGVITLCTVGYGDTVPITWQGKLIASGCALMGISFFALPAGILGSGFALKVQQQQRQKHMIRRRQPAATLIQCLWRCYAADEHSHSVATWKIHQVPLPSPTMFKHNASFVTRLPTIRRHKTPHSSHGSYSTSSHKEKNRLDNHQTPEELSKDGKRSSEGRLSSVDLSEDDEEQAPYIQLTRQHKGAIRALRKIKYFVARRKFREALKPYDVKDVIEQYTQGHADLLARVKTLHFRLDQILGKSGSKAKDVYESKMSLASRIVRVERQVDDIESKIDQLLDMYTEDRNKWLRLWSTAACQGHASVSSPSSVDKLPLLESAAPVVAVRPIPKPILVTSEPSTPTMDDSALVTDLAQPKVKKKVTLKATPSVLTMVCGRQAKFNGDSRSDSENDDDDQEVLKIEGRKAVLLERRCSKDETETLPLLLLSCVSSQFGSEESFL